MAIRKKTIYAMIFMMILTIGVVCIYNDYSWYDTAIAKVESEHHSLIKTNANGETHYEQTLTGRIMNGTTRGQEVQMRNKYSSSGVYDDQYQIGDEVFVDSINDHNGALSGTIAGLKRDKFLAILIALFAMLLFIVTGKKGIFSMISLILNVSVFYFALDQYGKGHNILMLSNLLVLFFTISSLFFISGRNKKTLAAVLSTLLTLLITMLLFKIVILFTNGIDYSYLLYVQNHDDLTEIFFSQIMLGGLGAIMDVAVTEASTIHELVSKNSEIALKELIRSGREVGHDIMGTMINVMLFTYICGSIPLMILKMNNDIKFHTIIHWHMPMEIDGFLIESIGILLTIPISLLISVILFRKQRRTA